ncbi:TetR family transcriptional regulator [Rhodococcus gordoniae]|uniref:TetR family transcriptional regulator n=1 Tax=Rhodococcus gordoniae TaxID=223392 RepID=A0A379M6E0_9NOCA|nr:TetR family transcriptional regulator [Rhodococcus gordoniae]
MVGRQVRAEVTRESVLQGAATVFVRDGYADANLGDIIEEAGVTKGALYFHFGSKEELARGVIDSGYLRFAAAAESKMDRRSPALETLIDLSVLHVDMAETDPVVRAMFRLLVEIGDYQGTEHRPYETWQSTLQELATRAAEEGDLVEDVDVHAVSLLLLEQAMGARIMANALKAIDRLAERTGSMWRMILPALVPANKLEYFRQFVERRLRLPS